MNYLAHAWLSFHLPEILVGNIISDFVKGKKKFDFPAGIQKGIALHRAIDDFTDTHPATISAKQYFRPVYRLYSAAFIDVAFDHFLANDRNEFPSAHSLHAFTDETYRLISAYENVLPAHFQKIFPYMKLHNWLYNYQFSDGIHRSFGGLVHRAKYLHESDSAFAIFEANYEVLRSHYQDFFPELKQFAVRHLQLLQNE
jgi:acyl carrier protein phosphodiesterase